MGEFKINIKLKLYVDTREEKNEFVENNADRQISLIKISIHVSSTLFPLEPEVEELISKCRFIVIFLNLKSVDS